LGSAGGGGDERFESIHDGASEGFLKRE